MVFPRTIALMDRTSSVDVNLYIKTTLTIRRNYLEKIAGEEI